jgi:uncharacterized protein
METEIYQLLKERKTSELLALLQRIPNLIFFKDHKNVSLLMLSLYFRSEEVGNYILSQRDVSDIFEAASCGKEDAVKRFLETSDMPIDAFSTDGFSALGFAAYFNRAEIVKILLEKGADPNIHSNNAFMVTPLHSGVAAKSFPITSILLQHGANPNARQQKNITPLHSAAHNGSTDIVQILLEYGADPKAISEDGKTAYDFAVESDKKDIMNLFR